MAVERPTLYQPIQGAWYRVLTLAGEVIEKMQFRQGAFHGLRGRVLALAEVERVAVRFAPGIAGGVDRYLPVNPSPREADPGYRVPVFERRKVKPRSTYGELPATLLVALAEHGPQTTAALAEIIGARTVDSVRTALGRMVHTRAVSRRKSDRRWQLGAPEVAAEPALEPTVPWKPVPYVNPIRARFLGLPVAPSRRDELDADFSNPRRVA